MGPYQLADGGISAQSAPPEPLPNDALPPDGINQGIPMRTTGPSVELDGGAGGTSARSSAPPLMPRPSDSGLNTATTDADMAIAMPPVSVDMTVALALDAGVADMQVMDGPVAQCRDQRTRAACDTLAHCWYGAPGCSENENEIALPPRLAGCQDMDLRCEDMACGPGQVCRSVLNDPCAERLCDMCAESIRVCLPDVQNAQLCGSGRPICPADQYCQFNQGDVCGAVGRPGTCRALPEDCPQACQSVCGCDGQTYCNACQAAAAGRTDVRFMGVCPMAPPPPMDERCLQTTHPDVRVLARGEACADLQFECQIDEVQYSDRCSCGCIFDAGRSFSCAIDADCVPENCCRPTGCVAQADEACRHDEFELGCIAADCRPAVAGCGCIDGLCRTEYNPDRCE
ncbi:MAG: hypothetical protein VX589_13195 [Myxococcota bacterium]|nr:hypothetical protein [Myxococcota bacterium]